MTIIKYSSTLLAGSGKSGKLVANESGEYTFCVGALNIKNSAGAHYDLAGSKDLFEASSSFMHRVKNGGLYAENGHPVREAADTDESYFRRIHTIREDRVCAFISDIWLDHSSLEGDAANPNAVAIMAKIKPFGELGQVLSTAIENLKQNVCFSVRGFTKDKMMNGTTHRTLTNIITFDFVTMPGIAVANRSNSGSLETLNDYVFDSRIIEMDKITAGISGSTPLREAYAAEGCDLAVETLDYYSDDIKPSPNGSIFS